MPICDPLKNFNKKNQDCTKKVFDLANGILGTVCISWVIVTSIFLGGDIFDSDEKALDPAHSFGIGYLIFGLIILFSIIFYGNKINHQSQPS